MALRSASLAGVHKRRTLVRNRGHIWTKDELDHFSELAKRPRFEPSPPPPASRAGLRRCKPPRPSSFARALSELAAAIETEAFETSGPPRSNAHAPPPASTSSVTDAGDDGSGPDGRSLPQTPQTPLRESPPRHPTAAAAARAAGGIEVGLINLSL